MPLKTFDQWREDSSGTLIGPDLDAEKMDFGPNSRPLISTEETVIDANTENSVQDALDKIPFFIDHQYDIQLPSTGSPYNEHLTMWPSIVSAKTDAANDEGAAKGIRFRGTGDNPSVINSLYVIGVIGSSTPSVANIEFTADVPNLDENMGFGTAHARSTQLWNCSFTDGCTNGVLAYDSVVKVAGSDGQGTDFGANNVAVGMETKRGGEIYIRDGGATGTTTGIAHKATSGKIFLHRGGTNLDGNPTNQADQGIIVTEGSGMHFDGGDLTNVGAIEPSGFALDILGALNINGGFTQVEMEREGDGKWSFHIASGGGLALRDTDTEIAPLFIQPGSPEDALFINSNGNIELRQGNLDVNENEIEDVLEDNTANIDPTTDAPDGFFVFRRGDDTTVNVPYYTE